MTEPPVPPDDPRVRFAGERTLRAWVRTALELMGFGFVVTRFGVFLHELAPLRPDGLPPAPVPSGLSV
jgi:putative membrane protein